MVTEKTVCMGCMAPLEEGDTSCSQCGYPLSGANPPEYMPVRSVVGDRYLVGRVLEVCGDSAVYIGMDRFDNTVITVREFFPSTLCSRGENGLLTVNEGQELDFANYKQKFLNCARAVARLRDVLPVVPCFDILEENGTAYSISEYCNGISLERFVSSQGPLPYEQARSLFLPLIAAVAAVHSADVMHWGITPKNILVDATGVLRLKNFSIPDTHTVTTKLKPALATGYAAPEQYDPDAVCTVTADVYGLAASLYFALTGKAPTDARQRVKKHEGLLMPAAVAETLPEHVKSSMRRALRISPLHRTQTAQQLWDELTTSAAVAALKPEFADEQVVEEPKEKKSHWWVLFLVLLLLLAVAGGLVLYQLDMLPFFKKEPTPTTPTTNNLSIITTAPSASATTTTVPQPSEATVRVENVVGQTYDIAAVSDLTGKMTLKIKGYEFSELPAGTVLKQFPEAGVEAPYKTEIEVILSMGSADKTIPNLTGWQEEHARLYLQALGFKVGQSMIVTIGEQPAGYVEQTTPAAGEIAHDGDTVILWVREGKVAATTTKKKN